LLHIVCVGGQGQARIKGALLHGSGVPGSAIWLSPEGVFYLALGGVFYTIGGIIYGLKPKCLNFKYLSFHDIFHIFVMLGSLTHFYCVFNYVI
ncbi:MAG: hemolysin III family protein, partial [Paeniclostridium sordellii]|nr:hemolysin III family protein [Paeniclostridium sordellii]